MTEPVIIAINGAESTGKTALAQVLSARLADLTGQRCTWVPEQLRLWCSAQGRTPCADEQMAIAMMQELSIDTAALTSDIVVCDTTPLMTAIYSRKLFNDNSIDALALRVQQRVHITLLTALDIAWVADGLQRDGPQVREPVDTMLREFMQGHGLGWSVVTGSGATRLENAVAAVTPLLAARGWLTARGRFTGLETPSEGAHFQRWSCECGDGDCEHRSLRLLLAAQSAAQSAAKS